MRLIDEVIVVLFCKTFILKSILFDLLSINTFVNEKKYYRILSNSINVNHKTNETHALYRMYLNKTFKISPKKPQKEAFIKHI